MSNYYILLKYLSDIGINNILSIGKNNKTYDSYFFEAIDNDSLVFLGEIAIKNNDIKISYKKNNISTVHSCLIRNFSHNENIIFYTEYSIENKDKKIINKKIGININKKNYFSFKQNYVNDNICNNKVLKKIR